jgi:hypothetical protein
MNNKKNWPRSPARPVALVAGLLPLVVACEAAAFDFSLGEVEGSLDNTVSYGQLWRVQGRDKSNDNINGNDGNRNFDKGLVSQVFKITSELQANYQNYGVFIRGSAFYDTQIMDHHNDYNGNNDPVQPSQNYPKDSSFTKETRDKAGSDTTLLDAYVFGHWDLDDHPLSAKLGRQVFNWGEGLFYRGGVNTSNPIDATKFRLPGSEVKEVLMPLEAVNFTLGLTDSLSMEAYYQWNWHETAIDPVGTYFSQTDLFGDGGNTAYASVDNPVIKQVLGAYPLANQFGLVGNGPYGPNHYIDPTTNTFAVANIGKDINARDDGQFGVAFRYIAESLNDTEFGFYFVNYHAQEPQLAVDFGNYQGVDIASITGVLQGLGMDAATAGAASAALGGIDLAVNSVAHAEYPEDIRMYGVSFNTVLGNASVFGELAYRPNLPIAMASPDEVVADILSQSLTGLSHISDSSVAGDQACAEVAGQQLCRSGSLHNYQRVEAFDTSLGTIYNFGPALTFDSLIGVAEIASEHIRGSSLSYTAYDGSSRPFAGAGEHTTMDPDAYGFTLTASGTWNNVLDSISLAPFAVYKNDFKGVSYSTGRFNEGAKAYSLGVTATYLGNLQAQLQYTNFYGAGNANVNRDRDNIGVNLKYSF